MTPPPVIAPGSLAARPQPALPCDDLLLRPWEAGDAPAFLSAYQDETIRRWHTRRPSCEADALEWFDTYRRDWATERGGHWAVEGVTGEVLGRIALRGWDFDDGLADVAYWVVPAARRRGVAARGGPGLSPPGPGRGGFHRLALDHSTHNHASCRVALKSGYDLEGTKRSAAVHDDGRHDMHLHARIREV
ncbi:GNAT family N-acetyltransferase [Streptomyces sp. N35]|uniref:GNAT family N-acetyltransferase n=1 Tax=Streptomyces sp. N35 TaxID=2795730 RepID=UPI0027DE049C|nr:GNAT family N-acetyltransferase [Streptomyces sp. N35]